MIQKNINYMIQQKITNAYFNLIDILIIAFIITILLNALLVKSEALNLFNIAKWCALSIIYILVRYNLKKAILLYGILIWGLLEVIIVFFQKLQWIDSNHHLFEVTGTFDNPGPLGGLLAISLTVLLGFLALYRKKYRIIWLGGGLIVCFAIALFLSNSRAGWLATICGVCFFVGGKFRLNKISFFSKFCIAIIFASICLCGYLYKKDSADGRLFIWRVTFDMIKDAPFSGHGIGSFTEQYMYYQAQYFTKHPFSKYKILADNIIYPYNELLHIWVELGLIGFVICLLIIGVVLFFSSHYGLNKIYIGGFIALTVYSMFSYPSSVFSLLVFVPLLLAGIDSKIVFKIKVSPSITIFKWIILLIGIFLIGRGYYYYSNIEKDLKILCSNSPSKVEEAKRDIEKYYRKIQCIPQYFDIYAQYCYLHSPSAEGIMILEKATKIIPTSELFCDLGDLYMKEQNINRAIRSYTMANKMLPCRILPQFKLFSIYRQTGDTINMRLKGEELLATTIKVENTQALRIKEEVMQSLKEIAEY